MARDTHDHYFREAKRAGYRSRAAYKLIEIDDRRHVLRKGNRVLDAGCAPGSWLQVAAKRVGPKGAVVGIDLTPIHPPINEPNVKTLEGDLMEIETSVLLDAAGGRPFDVVLSDMAPSTTGTPFRDHHASIRLCEGLLDRVRDLLRPSGNLVMKVFEGEAYPDLLARTGEMFERARGFRPKASRAESVEMFIVAQGYVVEGDRNAGADEYALPPKRPSPPPGW